MTPGIVILIASLSGYLLGAIPFGYLVAKAYGFDILREGSRNPGATNVRRVVGKRAGNTVFALDFLKGAVATGWPLLLQLDANAALVAAIVGLCAAILGHSFSLFLRGRGGKGVATAMGGLIVIMPKVVAIGLIVWITVFFLSRYVSLASILFALSLPASNLILGNPPILTGLGLVLAALIIARHLSNIQRLLNGTEHRFVRHKNG